MSILPANGPAFLATEPVRDVLPPSPNLSQAPPFVLNDAATIVWDASLGPVFEVTLGGDRTLGAPANAADGNRLMLLVYQDGLGGRHLSYNAVFRATAVNSGALPTLGSTAGKLDRLGFQYDGANARWDLIAYVPAV